ncbi:MAG: ABC transporter substrate-binding protein [Planctomycetota bacterium]|jgi:ABC-type transport system substrate-binding protein
MRCLVLLAGLLAGLLAAAGCAAPTTLRIAASEGRGPRISTLDYDGKFATKYLVYEGLTRLGRDGRVEGVLARSWEVLEGGRRVRFHLRRSVRFHDGSPLTAEAVVAHFRRWVGVPAHQFLASARRITRVESPAPLTVDVVLDAPYAPLLVELSFASPCLIMAPGCFDASGEAVRTIGTGPFRVATHEPDRRIVYERFDGYWGPRPGVDRVEWHVVKEAPERVRRLLDGEADLLDDGWLTDIPRERVPELRADARVVVHERPGTVARLLAFNRKRARFHDVRVRRAFNHAIDRRALIDAVLPDLADPTATLFPPGLTDGPSVTRAYGYDPERAAQLFDAAGWRDTDGDGVREADGAPLELELLIRAGQVEEARVAEVVRTQLARVGVTVRVSASERSFQRQKAYDFDLGIYYTWGVPYDPHGYLAGRLYDAGLEDTGEKTIFAVYAAPELNALIDRALGAVEPAKRAAAYDAVHAYLHAQAVVVPLYVPRRLAAHGRAVSGYRFAPSAYSVDLQNVRTGR